jgi:hypothetical protein
MIKTTKTGKLLYPRYYLKTFFNGKVVNDIYTKKIGRILFRIRGFLSNNKWDKAVLTFKYTKDYENKGEYTNVKDLEHAFRCFKEVINEF